MNETTETNDQNPWRPLEPGERADVNDTECLTPDGAWVKAAGCHGYTLEEWENEYRVTPTLRTQRPRPVPAPATSAINVSDDSGYSTVERWLNEGAVIQAAFPGSVKIRKDGIYGVKVKWPDKPQDSAPAAPQPPTPDTSEPCEGAGGGDNTQAKRYLCERCDAKDAYLSLIGETKKAGGGAVCLHGIRHPWECKACADAAWDLHKRASEAGGGDQHAWRCTRCGETDVPPSHVTYQETHDGGCGGACVVEPVAGGSDQQTGQTARGWLENQNWDGRPSYQYWDLASALADRADRAEAEAKGLFAALQIANREIDDRTAKQKAAEDERDQWKKEAVESVNDLEEGVKISEQIAEQRNKAMAERDALRAQVEALMVEHVKAICFIKELNATKFEHGRQYRSRCGKFLAALKTTNTKNQ